MSIEAVLRSCLWIIFDHKLLSQCTGEPRTCVAKGDAVAVGRVKMKMVVVVIAQEGM